MSESEKQVSTTDVFNITHIISLFLTVIVLAIVNVAITLFVLDKTGNLGRQDIVSIDAADLIKGFVAAQGDAVSQDELQARIRALNANIDPLIQAYAAERNVMVINAAAVLGGVHDITPQFLQQTGLVK